MRCARTHRHLLAYFALSALAVAQLATGTLQGRVTEPDGTAIPGVVVTIQGASGTAARTIPTDASGAYMATDLAPGVYRITAAASGFTSVAATVDVGAAASRVWNAVLTPSLSLSSLGFPASETQGNAAQQARLNRRAQMLKIHQTLGIITTVPLAGAVVTGFFAGGRATSSQVRNVHAGLGISTAALYGLTAYYAVAAPKIAGEHEHGPIRLHEIMAWIHGPGMILTPILGAMAYHQRSQGERVHGIAQLHGEVAIATVAAYTIAILAVTKHSGPPKAIHTGFNWLFRRGHPKTIIASAEAQR